MPILAFMIVILAC